MRYVVETNMFGMELSAIIDDDNGQVVDHFYGLGHAERANRAAARLNRREDEVDRELGECGA